MGSQKLNTIPFQTTVPVGQDFYFDRPTFVKSVCVCAYNAFHTESVKKFGQLAVQIVYWVSVLFHSAPVSFLQLLLSSLAVML